MFHPEGEGPAAVEGSIWRKCRGLLIPCSVGDRQRAVVYTCFQLSFPLLLRTVSTLRQGGRDVRLLLSTTAVGAVVVQSTTAVGDAVSHRTTTGPVGLLVWLAIKQGATLRGSCWENSIAAHQQRYPVAAAAAEQEQN